MLCLPYGPRMGRGCSVQVQPSMARELFAAGFVSCWGELDEGLKDQLVRSLEAALASPTIPPDIVTNLLNLAEFMEHDEKKLPLDSRCATSMSLACSNLREGAGSTCQAS